MAIELIISRDLALKLGATAADSAAHARQLLTSGHYMLLRDRQTSWPMFWLLQAKPPPGLLGRGSSQ